MADAHVADARSEHFLEFADDTGGGFFRGLALFGFSLVAFVDAEVDIESPLRRS